MGARVFISCGQRTANERAITSQVSAYLEKRGYETYFAIGHQAYRDVRENIFKKLKRVEYFLFIDFQRHSVFSHQELAIASFLETPLMAFQEGKAHRRRGLASSIQLNPHIFQNVDELLAHLERDLNERELKGEWDKNCRNELSIELYDSEPSEIPYKYNDGTKINVHFYHLKVRNNSRHLTAKDCTVFLAQAINEKTGEIIAQNVPDLKWAGLPLPYANLYRNKHERTLAAVCIPANRKPLTGCFYMAVDNSQEFHSCIPEEGTYLLTYSLISDNFPEVSETFRFTLGKTIEKCSFVHIG